MTAIIETRDIFIAHGWENSPHIHRLTEMLNRANEFDKEFAYVNHGNFDRSALSDETVNDLNSALRQQMTKADVALVMTDIYHDHKEWINKEIKLAKDLDIPVILIRSFESLETPPELEEIADEIVVFDPEEIMKKIKSYG